MLWSHAAVVVRAGTIDARGKSRRKKRWGNPFLSFPFFFSSLSALEATVEQCAGWWQSPVIAVAAVTAMEGQDVPIVERWFLLLLPSFVPLLRSSPPPPPPPLSWSLPLGRVRSSTHYHRHQRQWRPPSLLRLAHRQRTLAEYLFFCSFCLTSRN